MAGLVDVFVIRKRHPVAWYTVADDGTELARCIRVDQLAHPIDAREVSACVIADPDSPPRITEDGLDLKIAHRHEKPALTAAGLTAAKILAGEQAGWVNLRRDALAVVNPWAPLSGMIRLAVVLGLVLGVAMTAAFSWRGMRYAEGAERYRGQQEAVYRKLYPGGTIPGSIPRRLSSELRRVAGVRGAGKEIPREVSALDTLRRLIANLPAAVRLRILEMRVGPNGIFLEGQTRSHSGAEAVERSLSAVGFGMEAPHTERIATGGVTFALAGTLRAKEEAPRRRGARP